MKNAITLPANHPWKNNHQAEQKKQGGASASSEQDLDALIRERLTYYLNCYDLPSVCATIKNEAGYQRVFTRVKQLILHEGLKDVDAALAYVDNEINLPGTLESANKYSVFLNLPGTEKDQMFQTDDPEAARTKLAEWKAAHPDAEVIALGLEEEDEENSTREEGGLSSGMTVADIAAKHGVDISVIQEQLAIGVQVEQEHTSDAAFAYKIAMDHLVERPDYYTMLQQAETQLATGGPLEGTAAYYHFGEFSGEETMPNMDELQQLDEEALRGFSIRPEDRGKIFYADPEYIDDDEDGIAVKHAYAIAPQMKEGGAFKKSGEVGVGDTIQYDGHRYVIVGPSSLGGDRVLLRRTQYTSDLQHHGRVSGSAEPSLANMAAKGFIVNLDNKYYVTGFRDSKKSFINSKPLSLQAAEELIKEANRSGLFTNVTLLDGADYLRKMKEGGILPKDAVKTVMERVMDSGGSFTDSPSAFELNYADNRLTVIFRNTRFFKNETCTLTNISGQQVEEFMQIVQEMQQVAGGQLRKEWKWRNGREGDYFVRFVGPFKAKWCPLRNTGSLGMSFSAVLTLPKNEVLENMTAADVATLNNALANLTKKRNAASEMRKGGKIYATLRSLLGGETVEWTEVESEDRELAKLKFQEILSAQWNSLHPERAVQPKDYSLESYAISFSKHIPYFS